MDTERKRLRGLRGSRQSKGVRIRPLSSFFRIQPSSPIVVDTFQIVEFATNQCLSNDKYERRRRHLAPFSLKPTSEPHKYPMPAGAKV
jgi:hypothetical protein